MQLFGKAKSCTRFEQWACDKPTDHGWKNRYSESSGTLAAVVRAKQSVNLDVYPNFTSSTVLLAD